MKVSDSFSNRRRSGIETKSLQSPRIRNTKMNARSAKRLERRLKTQSATVTPCSSNAQSKQPGVSSYEKFSQLLAQDEDVLLDFVAKINKLFQEQLGRPAPFVSFVICGMQSSGKSTIMERFLNNPVNIVQEGTGKFQMLAVDFRDFSLH